MIAHFALTFTVPISMIMAWHKHSDRCRGHWFDHFAIAEQSNAYIDGTESRYDEWQWVVTVLLKASTLTGLSNKILDDWTSLRILVDIGLWIIWATWLPGHGLKRAISLSSSITQLKLSTGTLLLMYLRPRCDTVISIGTAYHVLTSALERRMWRSIIWYRVMA